MTEHFPIPSPPPELVQQWREEAAHRQYTSVEVDEHIAEQASDWGADQELEACCEWLRSKDILEPAIEALRADRRPKPPTLKELALNDLDNIPTHDEEGRQIVDLSNIRQALEQLPN